MSHVDNYYELLTKENISSAEAYYTPKEAASYLLNKFSKRNPKDVIESLMSAKAQFYNEELFCKLFNKDNIKRWFEGKPISRDKAFEIAAYFQLSLKETETFVRKSCHHDWIYHRDYKDNIYYFFITNSESLGLNNYQIIQEMRNIISHFEADYNSKIDYKINANEKSDSFLKRKRFEAKLNSFVDDNSSITLQCKKAIDRCKTIEDLKDFLVNHTEFFGEFNRNAYRIFKEELDYALKKSGLPITRLLEYISLDFKRIYKATGIDINGLPNSDIVSSLKNNNPDRQGIEATLHKKKAVTRKQILFLLLYNTMDDDILLESTKVPDIIAERRLQFNLILDKCGMPLLDPMQSFDWLILNTMSNLAMPYANDMPEDILFKTMVPLIKKIAKEYV